MFSGWPVAEAVVFCYFLGLGVNSVDDVAVYLCAAV